MDCYSTLSMSMVRPNMPLRRPSTSPDSPGSPKAMLLRASLGCGDGPLTPRAPTPPVTPDGPLATCNGEGMTNTVAASSIKDHSYSPREAVTVRFCNYCSLRGNLRCTRCKKAHYCSVACQTEDWKVHRHSCMPSTPGTPMSDKVKDTPTSPPMKDTPTPPMKDTPTPPMKDIPTSPPMKDTPTPPPMKDIPTSPPIKNTPTLPPMANGHNISDSKETHSDVASPQRVYLQDLHKNNIAHGAEIQASVVEFRSPGKFYIHAQSPKLTMSLSTIATELQKMDESSSLGTPYMPDQGEVCAIKFSLDQNWYRGLVQSVSADQKSASVHYIDFGNEETVSLDRIKPLPADMEAFPPCALECHVAGVTPLTRSWGGECCIAVWQLVVGKNLTMTVVEAQEKEITYAVDMLLSTKGRLSTYLIDQGYAVKVVIEQDVDSLVSASLENFRRQSRGKNENTELTPPGPLTQGLGDTFTAVVTHLQSPYDIICQKLENASVIQELQLNLREYCSKAPASANFRPAPGTVCCTLFSEDNQWYRAKVLAYSSEERVCVGYVDFGNSEEVDLGRLQPLSPELLALPTQAFPCALAGVRPVSQAWCENGVQVLRQMVSNRFLRVEILGEREGTALVTMVDESRDPEASVAELLVASGYALPTRSDGELAEDAESRGAKPAEEELLQWTCAELPSGDQEVALLISVIEHPGEFYCYISNPKDSLMELGAELKRHCEADHAPFTPTLGGPCCALFSGDGMWYRGVVQDVLGGEKARIYFVDYGNVSDVETAHLRAITPFLLKLPFQAVRCCLAGVEPLGPKWSGDALRRFQALCMGQHLQGRVVSVTERGYAVQLECNGQNVGSTLLSEQLAKAPGETQTTAAPKTPQQLALKTPQQLTPKTPQQLAPITPQQLAPKTPQQLAPKTPQQLAPKTPQQLAPTTPQQLAPKTPQQLAPKTPQQLAPKTPQQLAPKTPQQLAPITPQQLAPKTPQQLAPKTPQQLAPITPQQLAPITPQQLAPITPQQLAPITPQQLAPKTPQQLAPITPQQLAPITPQQLAPKTPQQLAPKTPQQLAPKTPQQLAPITPQQLAPKTPQQLAPKTPQQLAPITPQQLAPKTPQQLAPKTPQQLAPKTPQQAPPAANQKETRVEEKSKAGSETASFPVDWRSEVLPLNTAFQPRIGAMVSPSLFYVLNPSQVDVEKLQHVMRDLAVYCQSQASPSQSKPTAGAACCAQFSGDKVWYRAVVLETSETEASVIYADYGNSERVALSSILPIPRELLQLPFQITRCALAGKERFPAVWPTEVLELYAVLLCDDGVAASVQAYDGEYNLLSVTLNKERGGGHLNRIILDGLQGVKADQGTKTGPVAAPTREPECVTAAAPVQTHGQSPSVAPVTGAKPAGKEQSEWTCAELPSGGQEVALLISVIEHPGEFYCYIYNSEDLQMLVELGEELKRHCEADHAPFTPVVGGACCALFSGDGMWYRGVVQGMLGGDKARVYFVDYGNVSDVETAHLRAITPFLLKLPFQAVRCSLAGVEPLGPQWSADALRRFQALCVGQRLQGRVVSITERGYVVQLECNGQNIASALLSEQLAKAPGETQTTAAPKTPQQLAPKTPQHLPTPPAKETAASAGPPKATATIQKEVRVEEKAKPDDHKAAGSEAASFPVDWKTEELPRNKPFQPCIASMISPSLFYVLNPGQVDVEKLQHVMRDLAVYCQSQASPSQSKPTAGAACCAQFSGDKVWYRAVVLETSETEASVIYADYGNSERVALSSILPIPRELLQLPFQITRCALIGKEHFPSLWPMEVLELFGTLLSDGVLASVQAYDGECNLLTVTLSKERGGGLLNRIILEGLQGHEAPGAAGPVTAPTPEESTAAAIAQEPEGVKTTPATPVQSHGPSPSVEEGKPAVAPVTERTVQNVEPKDPQSVTHSKSTNGSPCCCLELKTKIENIEELMRGLMEKVSGLQRS